MYLSGRLGAAAWTPRHRQSKRSVRVVRGLQDQRLLKRDERAYYTNLYRTGTVEHPF
ncbi:hypothetical protein [Bacillus pumilus]|uniref:hypothetical protein n=1 Tax=Bacillus pumilus TaxID=1408 RepID=UPI001642EB47|nr:hypothetical protein [Bacillus pumilus]